MSYARVFKIPMKKKGIKALIPVKAFNNAKLRLSEVLSPQQRARFSYLMLEDILLTLSTSSDIENVTIISSDIAVKVLAEKYDADLMLTSVDSGYSEDVTQALSELKMNGDDRVVIFPSDVPQLRHEDLSELNNSNSKELILCPATSDGGTNAFLFTVPLPIPLSFGVDSLRRFVDSAMQHNVPVNVKRIAGLERDIDQPSDLEWFRRHSNGGQAWAFIQEMEISNC